MDMTLFNVFKDKLKDPSVLIDKQPDWLIDVSGETEVYYLPFEYVNTDAKIVLVGITPGKTQLVNGLHAARTALISGERDENVLKAAKLTAAFSGEPMRSNLIKQLNDWGVPDWLGINDSSDLFGEQSHLVHNTSLLRYPVFHKGNDYRGNTPNMLRHPLLRHYLEKYFISEIESLPEAIFIGLGPAVQKVMDTLVREGKVPTHQVYGGMLHPSGNNTYRLPYLISDGEGDRPYKTNAEVYWQGRNKFRDLVVAKSINYVI